ncbi:hypothetical protein [Plesiomonas shigelloides]|uniref:hypothetical protein n=1 Tax=Plesiomonas shigelloides TaxID=703 RepID=UPI0012613E03|nr:hypothetical protein [Plesiomonas shigelloides]KAB7661718.1 hypothetical protein GBN25_14200 [Plesiomonas shigelloides]
MIKELDSFKTRKFEEYLNDKNVTDDDVLKVISDTLSRPDMIIIRGSEKRRKRDAFLEKLIEITEKRSDSIKELIINKVGIILLSEELYDNISEYLDKSKVSELNSDKQVWAHLNRVEKEFIKINDDFNRYKEKKINGKISSHYLKI